MSSRSVCIRFYVDDSELPWNYDYFKGKRGHDPRRSTSRTISKSNMTKVGTFGAEMDKIGTFSVTKYWALYDWSLYRARVLRAHAGP